MLQQHVHVMSMPVAVLPGKSSCCQAVLCSLHSQVQSPQALQHCLQPRLFPLMVWRCWRFVEGCKELVVK
jgi:hypothetical protein